MRSTVNRVRQALVELWRPAFPDALVQRGSRMLSTTGELVIVSDATGDQAVKVMSGPRRPVDEDYELLCVASVSWSAGSVEQVPDVEDRCEAIVDEAQRLVLADPRQNLGVEGVQWIYPIGRFSQIDRPASESDGHIACRREFTLSVKARSYLS